MNRQTKYRLTTNYLIVLLISLTGCFLGAGTHGSIKTYHYSTTKDKLEIAVSTVIKSNSNIYPDTIKNNIIYITDCKNDTIPNDFYNDGKAYVTFEIKVGDLDNEYTFRYSGSKEDWKTSSTSEISICYIYDEKGNGGSEGNGNFDKTPSDIKKKMIALFETEFVNRVDKELNLKHTDE
jgi:hypothetical protein